MRRIAFLLLLGLSCCYAHVFLSVGDSGLPGKRVDSVGRAMSKYKSETDTVLQLGDAFYEDGVDSVTDPLFEKNWRKPLASQLSANTTWYSILGNHDMHKSPEAQIQYHTAQPSDSHGRWFMPSPYYAFTTDLGEQGSLLTVMIDTFPLDAVESLDLLHAVNSVSSRKKAKEWKMMMERGEVEASAREQLVWLEDVLRNSTADWVVVAGHYGILSAADHGDNQVLRSRVAPILEKYHVDLYLCGHDHTLQHLQENNVHYLVNGAGSRYGNMQRTPHSTLIFGVEKREGFMVHRIHDGSLTTEVVASDGEVLHTFTLSSKVEARRERKLARDICAVGAEAKSGLGVGNNNESLHCSLSSTASEAASVERSSELADDTARMAGLFE